MLLSTLCKVQVSALCRIANQKNRNGTEEKGRCAEMVPNSAGQSHVITETALDMNVPSYLRGDIYRTLGSRVLDECGGKSQSQVWLF